MNKTMVFLVMLLASVSNVSGIDRELTKAEKEVLEVNKSFTAKGKAGDIKGALSFIHEDYIGSLGDGENEILTHKKDIADWLKTLKPGDFPQVRQKLIEIKVYGDVAIVLKLSEGPDGNTSTGMDTFIKQNGKWLSIGYMGRETERQIPFETLDTYTLVKVDKVKIPGRVNHGGRKIMLRSGTFIIAKDSRCISKTVFGSSKSGREVKGSYTQEGSKLNVQWWGAGGTEVTIKGDTLIMNNEGMMFIYKKNKGQ